MNLLLIFLGKKQKGKRDYTEGDVSAQLSTIVFIFPNVILFTVWRKKLYLYMHAHICMQVNMFTEICICMYIDRCACININAYSKLNKNYCS